MRVKTFSAKKSQKVSLEILNTFSFVNYNLVKKLIRNKDIKVNGKRISADIVISAGDEVSFYINDLVENNLDVIFEDENIIVVFKKRKIETVSLTGEPDLKNLIDNYLNKNCYAVHRLDRNTEGLVIFAKNEVAKKSLDDALKNRTIQKYYLALVYGLFNKQSEKMTAYLKKFENKSYVEIIDDKKQGYEKIQTNYKVIKSFDDSTLVEVELITGKTHQIRAHFAHIGHFVIGDEKYGDSTINKHYKKKYQNLCAYKIVFKFDNNDYLSYLNDKVIEIDKSKIDFCQNL